MELILSFSFLLFFFFSFLEEIRNCTRATEFVQSSRIGKKYEREEWKYLRRDRCIFRNSIGKSNKVFRFYRSFARNEVSLGGFARLSRLLSRLTLNEHAKIVLMHIHFRFIVNERSSPPRRGVVNTV